MEPPAKRLRILRSVEVDETNPDYMAAMEKGKAKLKSKFESIFSKFEAMPEAMTDEIDMRTGEVVIDRGHTRRLEREFERGRGKGKLLDQLIAYDVREGEADGMREEDDDDDEKEEESARDELAPSKSPEPRNRKQAPQVDIPPPQTPSGPAQQPNAQVDIPNASSSVVDWMHMVQFPQTPAGQLAHNALTAQITLAIQQALQQALTPLVSSLPSNTPGAQPQNPGPLFAPVRSAKEGAEVALQFLPPPQTSTPATAPTLHFPDPPETSDEPMAFTSSPLPVRPASPRQKRFAKGVYIKSTRTATLCKLSTPASNNATVSKTNTPNKLRQAEGSDGIINVERTPTEVQNRTRRKMKARTAKSERTLQFPNSRALGTDPPETLQHLPTPSSICQDETKERNEILEDVVEDVHALIASGDHFDADERDLLSLHGANDTTEDLPVQDMLGDPGMEEAAMDDDAELDELIVPSVEFDALVRNNLPISDTLEATFSDKRVPKELQASNSAPSKSKIPSSATKAKRKHQSINFQVDSESEDDLNLSLVGASPPSRSNATKSLTCTTCNKPFRSPRTLSLHQHTTHPISAITTEDELLYPCTPIKREPLTPPSNFLLATPTAYRTPISAPLTSVQSSAAHPKMPRSMFLKKVKQSWARKSGSGKRRSLNFTSSQAPPRKRAWAGDDDDGDSGDELA